MQGLPGFTLLIKMGTLTERGNKLLGDNVRVNLLVNGIPLWKARKLQQREEQEEVTPWIQGCLWGGEGKLKSSLVAKGFHFARGTCSHSHG